MSAKTFLRWLLGVLLLAGLALLGLLPTLTPPSSAPRVVPTIACGNVSFSGTDYRTGYAPNGIAVGDFTSDGISDLVVINFGDATGAMLRGNGDGSFQPALNFETRQNPRSMAAGDFDRDGYLDLVTTDYDYGSNPSNMNLLTGDGTGRFSLSTPIPAGSYPGTILAADFNRDGKLDLVFTDDTAGIFIQLGNGDGTFAMAHQLAAGNYPIGVAIVDLNSDGILDLAEAGLKDDRGSVAILFGYGDGTFAVPTNYDGLPTTVSLAVADVNRDGKPDLILATTNEPVGDGVAILLNDGSGRFGKFQFYPVVGRSYWVSVGDFNGDAAPDLSVAAGDNSVFIFMGNGDGSFAAPTNLPDFVHPTTIAVADLNVDGKMDMAVANSGSYTLTVLLNNCVPLPTLTPLPATHTATAAPPSVTASPTAVAVTASATSCTVQFSDVAATDYFYGAVRALACRGVVSGYSDGSFRPYAETTRAQLAKIVTLGFGLPIQIPAAGTTFADVGRDSVFWPYVETLAARGIVSGYACGSQAAEPCNVAQQPYYRPSLAVRRDQLAKIVVGAAGWPLINPPTGRFSDVTPGSTFYRWVETAAQQGILSGYSDGTFRPAHSALRGQIAKLVYGATP